MLPLAELLTIQIDPKGNEPRYRQLYFAFREAILDGRLSSGLKLPSTRALARELGLSRNTIAAAYEQLNDEGFILGKHGAGSFVSSKLPEQPIHPSDIGAAKGNAYSQPGDHTRRASFVMENNPAERNDRPRAFEPGIPALDQVPLEILSRINSRIWREARFHHLAYADPMGYPPLREAIATYLRACRAVRCEPEQILITNGAQQGLTLIADLLVEPGEPVWVEEPGYKGARTAFGAAGARLVPVPVDDQGLQPEVGWSKEPKPKLVYVSPSHQYPGGSTMSLERRLQLLDWSGSQGIWLIEDDYDSEYRYLGRPLASMQGLTQGHQVIYMGTFSKVLFPSLRLGYLVLPPDLLELFRAGRAAVDTHPPTFTQATLARFMEEGHFGSHLRRMRSLYAERRKALITALIYHCGDRLSWPEHRGGMHLAATAQIPINDLTLAEMGELHGIRLRALSPYYLKQPAPQGFVLGYAGYDIDELQKGAAILGELLPC